MRLFDSHTHLNSDPLLPQARDLTDRARAAGVDRFLAIGTDLTDSAAGVRMSQEIEGLNCTVGIHPHHADKKSDDYLKVLEVLAQDAQVCGIGEIGLDYHHDFSPKAKQQDVFRSQLELAEKLDTSVVIHCREAVADTLAILDEWSHQSDRVVFHCFTGTQSEAHDVLDRGYWLSFTGTITFKKSTENQLVAQSVPLDRVMLETDCPYLSPEPMRKVRPNEPALLVHTVTKFAELRGKLLEEIADITYTNTLRFFNLDASDA